MKLTSDIPCKNCITFAICNAQISDDNPWSDILFKLIPKCSLIKNYAESYDDEHSSKMVLQIAKFFKPKRSFVKYQNFIKHQNFIKDVLIYKTLKCFKT